MDRVLSEVMPRLYGKYQEGVEYRMKYRKKPVIIDAIQWKGGRDNVDEIKQFAGKTFFCWHIYTNSISIETLEGMINASKDDWIIKGIKGEFYPCKPDIFEATYEPVEESKQ